ncbi:hypothetical protein IV01_11375 [Pseudomonas syringae]|uniref:Uncharacterized protein n=1 Tax=Pseudomonas syringae TaxID=317 RepID=A0A085VK29_PSESX|nr:hypothetical protein IV01_11375 [Pseudomonas syringae]
MVAQSVDAQIRRSALARDKAAVVCQTDCVIVLRGQASLQRRTVRYLSTAIQSAKPDHVLTLSKGVEQ